MRQAAGTLFVHCAGETSKHLNCASTGKVSTAVTAAGNLAIHRTLSVLYNPSGHLPGPSKIQQGQVIMSAHRMELQLYQARAILTVWCRVTFTFSLTHPSIPKGLLCLTTFPL